MQKQPDMISCNIHKFCTFILPRSINLYKFDAQIMLFDKCQVKYLVKVDYFQQIIERIWNNVFKTRILSALLNMNMGSIALLVG